MGIEAIKLHNANAAGNQQTLAFDLIILATFHIWGQQTLAYNLVILATVHICTAPTKLKSPLNNYAACSAL